MTLANEDDEMMQIIFSELFVITTTVLGTGERVLFYFSDVQKEGKNWLNPVDPSPGRWQRFIALTVFGPVSYGF